ncbi:cysteine-rich CWC family protein [sulfur-oxidizing endosymbiont of Gigantopelta aegis]|uniref:cysteine-rich CWC family protein n=1 Tax=sulfur-oxidizing endosymbiont of Gigantopelta aegis TaxID=2794934 RepID=UPI003CCD3783
MSCAALCPVCGAANACHLAKEAKAGSQNVIEDCWCFSLERLNAQQLEVQQQLLREIKIPPNRCLCSACWNKFKSVE